MVVEEGEEEVVKPEPKPEVRVSAAAHSAPQYRSPVRLASGELGRERQEEGVIAAAAMRV